MNFVNVIGPLLSFTWCQTKNYGGKIMKDSQLLIYTNDLSNNNEKFNICVYQSEIRQKNLKIFSCSARKKGASGPPRIPDLKPMRLT